MLIIFLRSSADFQANNQLEGGVEYQIHRIINFRDIPKFPIRILMVGMKKKGITNIAKLPVMLQDLVSLALFPYYIYALKEQHFVQI